MNLISGAKPKTIEELKEYCEKNGFTSEKTRFFIGENYKEPKAFGIYKDEGNGEFIVYKNKDDGNRAIRYRGYDEAFAVGELYDRLQKEIVNQKQHYYAGDVPSGNTSNDNPYAGVSFSSPYSANAKRSDFWHRHGGKIVAGIIYLLFLLLVVLGARFNSKSRSHGSGSDNYYYNDYNYNNYDNNSYSDWGSDSWDSGYTDWGSDW
ncbi:hypothetical protein [Butyrivibrio sp. M55]|uniref:hypothetical protein n=1 Tax=Butyrivibrio sp. M55 TaxID=1855323 RepID=UPI0008E35DB4|nr:hypothetical protein [Butyrivibrio sp. M55]SFU38569.1 hypothetical protein SAMN05216540_101431 [Butyrivibrio sp. M55]